MFAFVKNAGCFIWSCLILIPYIDCNVWCVKSTASFLVRGLLIFSTTHFLMGENSGKEHTLMADYKEMYYHIFNKLTDLTEEIKALQSQMEEMYIEDDSQSDNN